MWKTLKWKASTLRKIYQERRFDKQNGHPIVHDQMDVISDLQNTGFAILENFIPNDICDVIVAEIDQLMVDNSRLVWSDDHKSDHRLFGIERLSPLIYDTFHNNETLRSIGENYLGYVLKNYMTLAGSIIPVAGNKGSGGGWHRDSTYSPQFKAIAYLTDVEEENGPYEYILGSNKLRHVMKALEVSLKDNAYPVQDINRRFTQEQIDALKSNSKLFTAKKGSVILTDTHGIHRGNPILDGRRVALTNYYVGTHRIHEFEEVFADLNLPA